MSEQTLYPIRLVVAAAWFLVSCLALALVALLPPFRYRIGPLYARLVCPPALRLLGIELEVRGGERLNSSRPCVFIVNHQHLLDGLLVGALIPPKTITVGKKSLRFIPVFGWLFWWTGQLLIDRGVNAKAVATMRVAQRRIVELGRSVIIAPEGTRSHGKGLLPFKRGAFHLGASTGMPLQPIVLSSFHKGLDLRRWRAGKVIAELLPPVPMRGIDKAELNGLIEDVRERMRKAIDALDAELLH